MIPLLSGFCILYYKYQNVFSTLLFLQLAVPNHKFCLSEIYCPNLLNVYQEGKSREEDGKQTQDWFSELQDKFDTKTVSKMVLCVLTG